MRETTLRRILQRPRHRLRCVRSSVKNPRRPRTDGWHRGKTAEILGISPSTLYRRCATRPGSPQLESNSKSRCVRTINAFWERGHPRPSMSARRTRTSILSVTQLEGACFAARSAGKDARAPRRRSRIQSHNGFFFSIHYLILKTLPFFITKETCLSV